MVFFKKTAKISNFSIVLFSCIIMYILTKPSEEIAINRLLSYVDLM